MENLYKLADHLIEEADRLALQALHSGNPAHVDIVLKFCMAHQQICESLEMHEDFDKDEKEKSEEHDASWGGDNPTPRRRRM